jgi:hypothetical protein
MTEEIKTKHTPGPWIIEDAQEKDNCFGISSMNGGHYIWKEFVTVYSHSSFRGQGKANAKLIAAAPDLLEALKRIADGNDVYSYVELLQIAREAVDKFETNAEQ